jgi:hypothetical protein
LFIHQAVESPAILAPEMSTFFLNGSIFYVLFSGVKEHHRFRLKNGNTK